jgi:hypothetical protein
MCLKQAVMKFFVAEGEKPTCTNKCLLKCMAKQGTVCQHVRLIREAEKREGELHDKAQSCCPCTAVVPDICWVDEVVCGNHFIRTDELQFTLYISKDN